MTLTDVYCRFNRARGMEVGSIIYCSTLKASFILYMETLLKISSPSQIQAQKILQSQLYDLNTTNDTYRRDTNVDVAVLKAGKPNLGGPNFRKF